MRLRPVGTLRSSLRDPAAAPKQGTEGAPDAWLEIEPELASALRGIAIGDELLVITWLHLADRSTLEVHPRDDPRHPLTGVFATRSPHRPNPLGLHPVLVREIAGTRLRIGPIEAIDGTPVVDVKRSWVARCEPDAEGRAVPSRSGRRSPGSGAPGRSRSAAGTPAYAGLGRAHPRALRFPGWRHRPGI